MTIKYQIKSAILVCVALLFAPLCGCSLTSVNIEDLLRAPILSNEYNDIQVALSDCFDSAIQLKYPTEGALLSPFAFGDWNGDGVQDAVVLFTMSESTTVVVAILNQDQDGSWQVAGLANGLSDTVIAIEFAAMQQDSAQQIVVSFLAQGEQYLAVYAYQDGFLNAVLQQPYSQYLVEDITGTGTDDLILITNSETDGLQMQMLTFGTDGFTQMDVPSFNNEAFTSYANITASEGASKRQYLIVDGFVGEGQTTLASEMIWYNTEQGVFEQTTLLGTSDLFNDSKRYSASLISRDIDEDGMVEIPVQYSAQESGMLNHVQNSSIALIAWMDFTSISPEKSFGLYDDEYNYYLAFPEEVTGNLLLIDGEEENTIEVRNLAGDLLYFSLRVVDFDENDSEWYQIGIVASKQIQVKIGDRVTSFLSVESLSQSIYLL